ncbi:MAG: gfo/Idh/MocA family oxidoreductase [Acidimicrobiia bacterium]|nr:gfo/Idh/MocA family oxidoreductase [Acidimicrobiia bacterium]
MLTEIKSAVVGTGFIGLAHVEALRRLGVDVIGVVGSSPERAAEKARESNLPRIYQSLDECVTDPSVDVVHIASPNHAHHSQALAVLEAGKHLVCEKPLGVNSIETEELVGAATAGGVVNAVCFNIRFYPLVHQMAALVSQGKIGEPHFVHGEYLQDWLLEETDWNWRLEAEKAGALRAVADIGSHWLDLARFVTGRRVTEVMAELHTFVPTRTHPSGPVESFATVTVDTDLVTEEMTSDDAASIMLRFEDGTRGQVTVSQVAAGHKNRVQLEVDGSESALRWKSEDPDALWIGHRGRPNEIMAREPGAMAEEASTLANLPAGHVEGFADTFRALFSQVYEDVAAGAPSDQPAYPTFADGHDAVCVTEAVAASSDSGAWVSVNR